MSNTVEAANNILKDISKSLGISTEQNLYVADKTATLTLPLNNKTFYISPAILHKIADFWQEQHKTLLKTN